MHCFPFIGYVKTIQMFFIQQTEATPQTDSLRACVTHQYPPDQLYQVTETHLAVDNINITVFEGDVVGVIMKKDPNGNRERWVVDNGGCQLMITYNLHNE